MKPIFYALILVLNYLPAGAEGLPQPVRNHPLAQGILAAHYIHIRGEGTIGVAYPKARAMLEMENVLCEIQRAYAGLLPAGETAEFEITREGAGTYSFVNRNNEYTRVVELLRSSESDSETIMVLYSEGVRGFGPFQSLTSIRVLPCPESENHSQWSVGVYAYPENSFSRFFARNLGIARRFFRRKTEEISKLAVDITLYLFENS